MGGNESRDDYCNHTVEVPASEVGNFAEEHANRAANPDYNHEAAEYAKSNSATRDPSNDTFINDVGDALTNVVADTLIGDVDVRTDDLGAEIAEEHGYTVHNDNE